MRICEPAALNALLACLKVCYPKPTDQPLYNGLITQCQSLGIPIVPWSDVAVRARACRAERSLPQCAIANTLHSPSYTVCRDFGLV